MLAYLKNNLFLISVLMIPNSALALGGSQTTSSKVSKAAPEEVILEIIEKAIEADQVKSQPETEDRIETPTTSTVPARTIHSHEIYSLCSRRLCHSTHSMYKNVLPIHGFQQIHPLKNELLEMVQLIDKYSSREGGSPAYLSGIKRLINGRSNSVSFSHDSSPLSEFSFGSRRGGEIAYTLREFLYSVKLSDIQTIDLPAYYLALAYVELSNLLPPAIVALNYEPDPFSCSNLGSYETSVDYPIPPESFDWYLLKEDFGTPVFNYPSGTNVELRNQARTRLCRALKLNPAELYRAQ